MRKTLPRTWLFPLVTFALLLRYLPVQGSADLLWFEHGRPSVSARQAVELLQSASSHGLDPADYAVPLTKSVLAGGAEGVPIDASTAVHADQELTAAMERLLAHLHEGRINPRLIHHGFSPAVPNGFDASSVLRAALATGRLSEAASAAAPTFPQYSRLRAALASYRNLVGSEAWKQPLRPLPPGPQGSAPRLRPGGHYEDLAKLAGRLTALGDLPEGAGVPPRYEGLLVEAVRLFQYRHGLPADGEVGPNTYVQLQVMPEARVQQIELTLERLRWTPLMRGRRMIVINVPEFVLRAYEVHDQQIQVREEMRVIVGKAVRTRTPLFDENMRFVEFSPYWNVPPSIARAEIVPKLKRDPHYLLRNGFELVSADGRSDSTVTKEKLDAVMAGKLRIRQKPGPQNALGDIKFIFPNSENIYLHHTPATQLFDEARRDFSHGCIRVEKPVALARFVLAENADWTEERIRKAMSAGKSSTLALTDPVPVVIAYGTALVKQDRVHFFPDIYGLDQVLDSALRNRRPRP